MKGRRRIGWIAAIAGAAVVGIVLGAVLSTLDDSPPPAHAKLSLRKSSKFPTRSRTSPPTGIGPGTKVKDPPGPSSVGAGEPAGLTSHWTGTCPVLIQNHYNKLDWNEQTKCAGGWGVEGQLVTVRNDSNIPVFANEWYTGGFWHGQTTIAPHKTVVMPVWGSLSTSLFVGACWPGSTGPGPCTNGPHNRKANVEIVRWQEIPSTDTRGLLFVRDENGIGVPATRGSKFTAVNLSEYPLQLHWEALGEDRWVDLAPNGKIENVPPGSVDGRKEFGEGAVALVQFIPTPHERGADLYHILNRGEHGGVLTPLLGSWCSVQLQNLSSTYVGLTSWHVPYVTTSGGLSLAPGASGTLVMRPRTFLITGRVGQNNEGDFATIKATNWTKCP
jgi:hypothetical protein